MTALYYREHHNDDDSIYFAIYPEHYVCLIKTVKTNEWMCIQRDVYDSYKPHSYVNWALSNEFTDMASDRFWALVNDATLSLYNDYSKKPKICATQYKTSV